MESDILHCHECGFDYSAGSRDAHCPRCLLDLALSLDGDPQASQRSTESRDRTFFAGYEIQEEIARGGVGIVYRARQIEPPREVALKMLQAGNLASTDARMRFELEIGAVAQLAHPGIVSLYESGEEDGELFFSMTFLPEGSLADWLKKKSRPPDSSQLRDRIQILISVSEAVHHAHQRGILHRDLKPSNILFNENHEPVVTDFGLVKMMEADSNLTLSQAFIGSPNYMAPEQATGGAAGATIAADVYGLGAVLYELMTSQPPFLAETPMETMRMAADDLPQRPRKKNPAIGKDLERVCLKGLEKSPPQRYSSAGELADDLRRWLDHRPVFARPRPVLAQIGLWCRRHPGVSTAIVAATILLMTITAMSVIAARRIEAANERTAQLLAEMQLEKAERLLEDGRTNEGLAMLAHVLKTAPGENEIIARRLQSELSTRSFAIQDPGHLYVGNQTIATAVSSDGKTAAAVSRDGMLRRWDLEGERTFSMNMNEPLFAAAVAPDCRSFWTANFEREMTLWTTDRSGATTRHTLEKVEEVALPGFDQSGRFAFAVIDYDKLQVWDCQSEGELVREFGNGTPLSCWATAPAHRFTIAGTSDGRLLVWDPQSNKLLENLNAHPGRNLARAVFNHSGTHLATATISGEIKVWKTNGWKNITMKGHHSAPLTSLSFSPNGRALVSASHDKAAKVWDTRTGAELTAPLTHENSVFMARFSPDSTRIATASEDGTVRLWDAKDGQTIASRMHHSTGVGNVFFRGNEDQLLTASFGGVLWKWEIHPPLLPEVPLESGEGILEILPLDAQRLIGGNDQGEIGIWNNATGQSLTLKKLHNSKILALSMSTDGKHLASSSYDHTTIVSSIRSDDIIAGNSMDHSSRVVSLNFDPTGHHLLTGTEFGRAHLWDWQPQKILHSTPRQEGQIDFTSFVNQGKQFLISSRYQLASWHHKSGKLAAGPVLSAGLISAITLVPKSDEIAVFTARRAFAKEINSLEGSERIQVPSQILSHCFSQDGSQVLVGCSDGKAYLWNWAEAPPKTAVQTYTLNEGISSAQISHDGNLIFTGGTEGTCRLWDKASGLPLSGRKILPGKITRVMFTPEDKAIFINSQKGPARLIPLIRDKAETAELIERVSLLTKTIVTETGHFETLDNETYLDLRKKQKNAISDESL